MKKGRKYLSNSPLHTVNAILRPCGFSKGHAGGIVIVAYVEDWAVGMELTADETHERANAEFEDAARKRLRAVCGRWMR